MSAIPFDTLKWASTLESAGFTPEQARGAFAALAQSLEGSKLATRVDFNETVANVKVAIVRWLIIAQLALGEFIFAALKSVK